MEALLSKLLERGFEGAAGEALTKPNVQVAIVELKSPESGNQETSANNQETTTTTADK